MFYEAKQRKKKKKSCYYKQIEAKGRKEKQEQASPSFSSCALYFSVSDMLLSCICNKFVLCPCCIPSFSAKKSIFSMSLYYWDNCKWLFSIEQIILGYMHVINQLALFFCMSLSLNMLPLLVFFL